MDTETLEMLVDNANERRHSIMAGRGGAYADDDILSNFKRTSEIAKILGIDITTPVGCALYLEIQKLDRTCNMIFRLGIPYNKYQETQRDNLDDRRNYIDLLEGLLVDSIAEKVKPMHNGFTDGAIFESDDGGIFRWDNRTANLEQIFPGGIYEDIKENN